MKIRENNDFNRKQGTYDADHAAAAIKELDQQRAAGEIEPHAYLTKKRSLVRLYLKATTTPRRKQYDEGFDL